MILWLPNLGMGAGAAVTLEKSASAMSVKTLELVKGEVLRVRTQRTTGSDSIYTVADGCSITIVEKT
jgi:hypothetical protein